MNAHSLPKKVSLTLLLILFCAGFIPQQSTTPVHKNIAVIFLKHPPPEPATGDEWPIPRTLKKSHVIALPRHTASIYTMMMNFKIPPFIREATYNHSDLHFDAILNPSSPDGWFDSPHSIRENLVFPDAIGFAYAVLGNAIVNYDGLIVVQNIQSLYGYTAGCGFTEHGGYVTCPISAGPNNLDIIQVTVGEQADDASFYAVLGHELGHVHSLEHVTMGPYDNVGNSPVLTHYGAWSKVFAGWADGITDMPYVAGSYELFTTLDPLNAPGNNVLRIPFFQPWGDQFVGYFVECRAKFGFDVNIPEEGVIITRINTIPGFEYAAHIAAMTGDDNYADAALSPGEAYVDEIHGLTITYLTQESGKRCNVMVKRGEIVAPDPWISLGSEVDSGKGYLQYSSRDIWIDSEQNGWDIYPLGYGLTQEGGEWHPTGYGDPFWVNHENRIKFMIRNSGFSDAEHVFVDVYVTQPMMLYLPCDDEPRPNNAVLVGTVEIDHLEKDGFFFGEVPWTPTSKAAAQVDVVIRDYVGEVSHVNNTASENYAGQTFLIENIRDIAQQEMTIALEGTDSVTLQTSLMCEDEIPYKFVRKVISAIDKKDWVMEIESMNGILSAGQTDEWALASIPPEDGQPGDCEEVVLELMALYDDIYVPVDGFTYQSCLVEPTELTCISPLGITLPGNTALINGKLGPADGGETIAMEYISPSGTRVLQYVTANPDGTYRDKFLAREVGTWKLQAFWQGTDKRSPAQSSVCTLVVKEPTPTPTMIPTAPPSPCGQYTTEPTCNRRTQCKWIVDVAGKGICTAK